MLNETADINVFDKDLLFISQQFRFYPINWGSRCGHGGFGIKVAGYVEHGSVVDYVDIYLGSPHFNSGLAIERIVVTRSEKAVKRN
jgi:hypothetical protein